jgi:Bacteriophage protein gp37
MSRQDFPANWNPWHGCTKISPGCRHCYVYRQDEMYGSEIGSEIACKTLAFDLPVKRKRDKSYKIPPGSLVFTCFTSDFLLEDADAWRPDCWAMIRERRDCRFYFFTKRIHRFLECVPNDWGDGYDNVIVGCTVENQAMADQRLPIFAALPIQYKTIIVAPMIERIDISNHLSPSIQEVSCGGESGRDARPLNFDWVLSLREQCIHTGVPFRFHQTGAKLIKDGRQYYIRRCYQHTQAKKAGVDFGD